MTFVYFGQRRRAIKIGISATPRQRTAALRCLLLGVIRGDGERERALHKRFRKYRREGEWFVDCHAIRSFIARNCFQPPKERNNLMTFRLPDTLLKEIVRRAEEEDVMVSQLVRRALRIHLKVKA